LHQFENLDIELNVMEANRKLAEQNRKLLDDKGIASFDIMGSIGSGKTLLIESVVDLLRENGRRPAVVVGDVAGDDDYKRFSSHEIPVININTGKDCHLDAHRAEHAMEGLDLDSIDILFVENVGNLVCPADFPLGTTKRVVVISVTEGDDMVRKHPLIFTAADVIVINKVDLADAIEVDPEVLVSDAKKLVPHVPVIKTDAKHGQGIKELMEVLGLNG